MMADMSSEVRAAFDAAPPLARAGMLALRALILAEAAALPQVGPLTEALRWGQPAYLTMATGSGSTLRLGAPKAGGFAIYAHCQTTLISGLRDVAADALRYEGNRAVLFDDPSTIRADLLGVLIRRALLWHRR